MNVTRAPMGRSLLLMLLLVTLDSHPNTYAACVKPVVGKYIRRGGGGLSEGMVGRGDPCLN
jgi:hypothetical protein